MCKTGLNCAPVDTGHAHSGSDTPPSHFPRLGDPAAFWDPLRGHALVNKRSPPGGLAQWAFRLLPRKRPLRASETLLVSIKCDIFSDQTI